MSAGLDVAQVRDEVVRPALHALGAELAGGVAELLLLGTAAAESDYRWLVQRGGGPAVGLWQMEPATYRDHWHWLQLRPELRARVLSLASRHTTPGQPPARELCWNLRLAAAMARIHYWRRPARLPSADPRALAAYWKRHYNTVLGRGTVEHFLAAWERHVAPILGRSTTTQGGHP